jgi:hypothetical protein
VPNIEPEHRWTTGKDRAILWHCEVASLYEAVPESRIVFVEPRSGNVPPPLHFPHVQHNQPKWSLINMNLSYVSTKRL